jgi:5-formyltetrahydrofolate cyclo-ligase
LLDLKQYRDAKRISIYLSMPSGEIQTDEIVRHALGAGKDVFVPYLHRNVLAEAGSAGGGGGGAPKKVMDMVRLKGVGDYEGLERDAWGIPTVTEEAVEGRERVWAEVGDASAGRRGVSLDLMLVPGVAFEVEEGERGLVRRLGHGKGFYDYFLHRYRTSGEVTGKGAGAGMALFGLALKEQFLRDAQETQVPTGPHDSLLDGLIMGDGRIVESAPT